MGSPPEDRSEGSARRASEAVGLAVRVCIATCGRPMLLEQTLRSVGAQAFTQGAPRDLRILVVDNDPGEQGRPVVDSMRAGIEWPIDYAVEPRRGISFARNRLVAMAAGADLIAFIDDDEEAEPCWLDALLATYVATGANAVLGPVLPRFDPSTPEWLRGPFERPRHPTGRIVSSDDFRTSNVLLERSAVSTIEGPFDPAFALVGGSDGHLGRVLEAAGARFAWSDEAVVREDVPASRARVGWILQRRFRTGLALAMIRLRLRGRVRGGILVLTRGAGAIGVGLATAATGLLRGRRVALHGLGVAMFGAGSLAALLGVRYQEYAAARQRAQREGS